MVVAETKKGDQALIEAKARGLDVKDTRQALGELLGRSGFVLEPEILGEALALGNGIGNPLGSFSEETGAQFGD